MDPNTDTGTSSHKLLIHGMRSNDNAAYDSTMMNKIFELITNINSWRKVMILAALCIIGLTTYYGYVEITKIDKLANINPWKYFEMQEVDDIDGLHVVLDRARAKLTCDMIAVMMYQPKDEYYYEELAAISPRGVYGDFEKYAERIPLHYLHRLLSEIHDAGLACVTTNSGHYDSRLMIAYNMKAAYAVPIKVRTVLVGHIIFAFREPPAIIPLHQMSTVAERAVFKIF